MRKNIYLITLFLIPFFSIASDSLQVEKLFVIKADLISVAVPVFFKDQSYFSITPEMNICKKQSVQLQLLFARINEDYRVERSIEIVPEYKYYFGKQTIGFFGGGYLKYIHLTRRYYSEHDNFFHIAKPQQELIYESMQNSIAFGPLIGYECNFKKHWVGEFIFGYGYSKNISLRTLVGYHEDFNDETHTDGVLSINIGYRF